MFLAHDNCVMIEVEGGELHEIPSMSQARCGVTLAWALENAYTIGGMGAMFEPILSVEFFDMFAEEWIETEPHGIGTADFPDPLGIWEHCIAVLNGVEVFVLGGASVGFTEDFTTKRYTGFIFDAEEEMWSNLVPPLRVDPPYGSLEYGLTSHGCAAIGDMIIGKFKENTYLEIKQLFVLVAGGITDEVPEGLVQSLTWGLDDAWHDEPSLPKPLWNYPQLVFADGFAIINSYFEVANNYELLLGISSFGEASGLNKMAILSWTRRTLQSLTWKLKSGLWMEPIPFQ